MQLHQKCVINKCPRTINLDRQLRSVCEEEQKTIPGLHLLIAILCTGNQSEMPFNSIIMDLGTNIIAILMRY